jgi:hypothetical protein
MIDVHLYSDRLHDLCDRIGNDDPRMREEAWRDYERCARAPNFGAALVGSHVPAAREALGSDALNAWERSFLESLIHYSNPSDKQLSTLKAIVAKARRGDRR